MLRRITFEVRSSKNEIRSYDGNRQLYLEYLEISYESQNFNFLAYKRPHISKPPHYLINFTIDHISTLLQLYYTSTAVLLHLYYTSTTPLLQFYCTSTAVLLHLYCTSAAPLLHLCYTSATPLLHLCYTSTSLLHPCYTCYTCNTCIFSVSP